MTWMALLFLPVEILSWRGGYLLICLSLCKSSKYVQKCCTPIWVLGTNIIKRIYIQNSKKGKVSTVNVLIPFIFCWTSCTDECLYCMKL